MQRVAKLFSAILTTSGVQSNIGDDMLSRCGASRMSVLVSAGFALSETLAESRFTEFSLRNAS